jgi:hypothetical protein
MRHALWALVMITAGYGGGTGAPPPASPMGAGAADGAANGADPARGGQTPHSSGDPFALPEGPRDDAPIAPEASPLPLDAWRRSATVKGVAPRPAPCAAYEKRAPAKPAPKDLATALASPDPAKRDAMLAAHDKEGPPGFVRTLRADLAPVECADALVDPDLTTRKTTSGPYGHVAVGLSLAAKLARTAGKPPAMTNTADKERVKAFIKGPLQTWMVEQATAIEQLSASAAGLSGYGRAIAAIEAGHADLRLVDRMRSAPVPSSWDAELKAVYEAALDEALEPRKARGRDAALAGLLAMADAGVLGDARVARARAMLAKLYGGRRIDALDALLLPAPPKPEPASPGEHALAAVPTFWFDVGAGAVAPDVPQQGTPAAFAMGVPRAMRAEMRSSPEAASPELRSAYARARLDLGRLYWRRVDFVEAAHAAKQGTSTNDRLVLAVALALATGPNGPQAMMTAPSPSALGIDRTGALDALAGEGGPLAGMAAYDAAHLRSLGAPDEPSAAASHLRDVATRFRTASELLTDPAQKKLAAGRAAEADAAAKAVESAR